MGRRPTIQTIAEAAGVSIATVSDALRDSRRVRLETRRRVFRVCEQLGYRKNPIITGILAAVRRANSTAFRGTLALVEQDGTGGAGSLAFRDAICAGAERRAAELGFSATRFALRDDPDAAQRLQRVLEWRRARGVIALSGAVNRDEAPGGTRLPWIRVGPGEGSGPRVWIEEHDAVCELLAWIAHAGFRRPGLVLAADPNASHRFAAAFEAQSRASTGRAIPLLRAAGPNFTAELPSWLRRFEPDVVIGDNECVVEGLRAAGRRAPEEIAFVGLNRAAAAPFPGIDYQPDVLGATAVDVLASQILGTGVGPGERVPVVTTFLPARFVPGALCA